LQVGVPPTHIVPQVVQFADDVRLVQAPLQQPKKSPAPPSQPVFWTTKVSTGQPASLPEQLSATSQVLAAERQTTVFG
jgi:hypothetical protein